MLKPTTLSTQTAWRRSPVNPFLKETVRSFKKSMVSVFFFSFFINLLTLAVPLYLLQIYSKVLPSRSMDTLLFLTGIALVAVVALGMLEAIRRSIMAKMGIRFDNLLSEHLLNSSINRAIHKGRTSVNVMRELASLRNFLSGSSIFPLLDMPWTPLFLFIMYLLHPLLGIVGVVGALIMMGLACFNEYATREPTRMANAESGELLEDARSYVKNADVIQAMGMHSTILNNWKQRNERSLAAGYKAGRINTSMQSLSKMVRLFLQVGVILVAAWLILQQQLSTGVTIVSVLLLRRAIAPLEQSIQSWKSVLKAREAFRNISEYLDHSATLAPTSQMPAPSGSLVAKRASFRRSGEKRSVFSSANITVTPGMLCALIGPTAAGKSSLLRVLAGIVPPTSGKVTLGGYELGQWNPDQLGPAVGFLPQDVCLFPGTVSENISRLGESSIDKVIEAAKLANAHELIQKLPLGYDTPIEEDGLNLSGGQRQRIGFARALYGSPAVVLLDEPDANLDSSGRSSLRKSLRELRRQDFAVLMITHRRSTERLANRVYKLESAKVSLVRTDDEKSHLKEAVSLDQSPKTTFYAANDADSARLIATSRGKGALPLFSQAQIHRKGVDLLAKHEERVNPIVETVALKKTAGRFVLLEQARDETNIMPAASSVSLAAPLPDKSDVTGKAQVNSSSESLTAVQRNALNAAGLTTSETPGLTRQQSNDQRLERKLNRIRGLGKMAATGR